MTDRARLVYALLRSLLMWAPDPQSCWRSQPGFASTDRPCVACAAAGRTDPACRFCAGTGRVKVRDRMDDPLKHPLSDERRVTHFGGLEKEARRDMERRRDRVLERLAAEEQVREGREAADDRELRLVAARDRLFLHGSYAELGWALERLRDVSSVGYSAAMSVAYQPFAEAPVEPAGRVLVAVCELLAVWMPERIRVPVSVAVWSREESERIAREGREALWRGRRGWHELQRGERDRLVVELAASGLSSTAIGFRLGLSRQHVRRILASREESAA